MSLTLAELRQVIDELAPLWVGARIQKIHFRGPQVALLSLQGRGQKGTLVLSVIPGQAGLYLTAKRGSADNEASPFCMAVRKWLKGTALVDLAVYGNDRVVVVEGGARRGRFVVELFPPPGRFVVCDDENRVVAWSPPAAMRAELSRGQPYAPPGPGRSPPPAPPSRLQPGHANEDAEQHCSTPPPDPAKVDAVRWVSRQLRRQRRLVQKVEDDLARARQLSQDTQLGELVKLHLGKLQRGMETLDVPNLFVENQPVVTIQLDPRRSPAGNLERLFARGRKGRRAVAVAETRLADGRRRLNELETLSQAIQQEKTAEEETPVDILAAARALGFRAPQQSRAVNKAHKGRLPYREYRDNQDRPLLVGRSGADNDTLTLKIARPHDLWLHARGHGGSHVVIPLNRGENVGQDRLLDGATLAAHFSQARREGTVEVTYTPRRYVQKPRGTPPGKVLLLQEKVLLLTMEPPRLARILSSRVDI